MSTKWVLRRVLGDGRDGQFLKSVDVNAMEGRGAVVFTDDWSEAMLFDSQAEALMTWRAQSDVTPLRLDGRPNRPLTAFSMSVVEVSAEQEDDHV